MQDVKGVSIRTAFSVSIRTAFCVLNGTPKAVLIETLKAVLNETNEIFPAVLIETPLIPPQIQHFLLGSNRVAISSAKK